MGEKKKKRRKEFFGGRDEESQNPVRKKFEDDIDCITAHRTSSKGMRKLYIVLVRENNTSNNLGCGIYLFK